MSDQDAFRDPGSGKAQPPSYSEVQTGYPMQPQGPPPGQPAGDQPYPQPYMQGYHHAPGTAPDPNMKGSPYPPPGQYPPGQPGYPQGQPGYPPGAYPQTAYGQPTASVVVTQPSGATVVVAQNPPPDNLVLSIIACLCCFCPTGIFAIMYSCQAKSANEASDFTSAMRYAAQAKKLAIVSIIIGIIVMAISAVLRLVVFTSHTAYSY